MRLLALVFACLCSATIAAQARPVPINPEIVVPDRGPTIEGVAPLLTELAQLQANGQDWVARAVAGGATVRSPAEGPQVLVELDSNGRHTCFSGETRLVESAEFSPAFRLSLAAAFPKAELVPTENASIQRVWTTPADVAAIFTLTATQTPTTTLQPWRRPYADNYGSWVTQGVTCMNTDFYEALGVNGSGVKVAILDIGFQGIDTTAAAEVGSYSRLASQSNLNNDASPHGTACAEIIRDVAPGCQLKVYRLDSYLDEVTATNDAIAWGADVISVSLAWFGTPGNGYECTAANIALSAGVTWVNAAGNYADQLYWESGNTQFMSFNGGYYVDYDYPYADPYQWLDTYPGYDVSVFLSYEAPTASYAQFQLEIWRWDGYSLVLIGSGTAGATQQWVDFTPGSSVYSYYALVRRTQAGTVGKMREFSLYAPLYFYSADGSVANPGSLANVLTIAAVDQGNYDAYGYAESYSSHGGGIWNLPLDWSAPTGVSTASYGSYGFAGTSAACPHMAGLMALQLSDPGLAAAPISNLFVTDVWPTGWDTATGLGVILAFVDSYEPDNAYTQATVMTTPSSSSAAHVIGPGVDRDWYRFTLSSPQSVSLQTSGSTGDTYITLYNSSLSAVASADNGGAGSFSLLYVPVLAAGTWYVKVEEDGNDGVVPPYTLALNVTNGPPGACTLTSPVNGASGQSLNPTLTWQPAQGLGTITYRCQVSTSASFATTVHDQSGLSGLSTTPGTLSYATNYYWRVQAANQYGSGAWSGTFNFTTLVGLPGAPALVSPVDGAVGESTSPLLAWNAPSTGVGPFTYEAQVAEDSGFTTGVIDQPGLGGTATTVPGLKGMTFYYWRVRASNAYGTGSWSTTRWFQTQAKPKAKGGGGSDGGGGCSSTELPLNWQNWLLACMALLAAVRIFRRGRESRFCNTRERA